MDILIENWFWAVWGVWFGVWEWIKLKDGKAGGTLSETVWDLLRAGGRTGPVTVRRASLGAFMLWLTYHFVLEPF